MRRIGIWGVLAAVSGAALATTDAKAHFRLEAPAVMTEMNALGDPQKAYPCGDASMTLTGDSTAFAPGDTVTITIDETIYHPGHYRVALAETDLSELPPDPPITPSPNDQCAMTEIMNPPVYPVLADGMLPHDGPFDGQQSFEVTLPEDVECENCTLQVVQYMSSHAAPCFYYHCAAISISGAGGGDSTGGEPGTSTGDPTGEPGTTSGSPETTGTPGETAGGGGDSSEPPETSAGGDTNATTASGGSSGTDTDASGQDDSSGGGGCRAGGGAPAGLLALLPLLFANRRRRD